MGGHSRIKRLEKGGWHNQLSILVGPVKAKKVLQLKHLPICFPPPMAKKSWIEKEKRKLATVKKYAVIRAELKAKKDYIALSQLPRNASPTRVTNRCASSGRRHGFIRRFNLSRLAFREAALHGLIPGVTKSSW